MSKFQKIIIVAGRRLRDGEKTMFTKTDEAHFTQWVPDVTYYYFQKEPYHSHLKVKGTTSIPPFCSIHSSENVLFQP